MRDDDHGAAAHRLFECLLNGGFRLGVERRSRLVQKQDGRVADECAGNRQALTLAAGKRHAMLSLLIFVGEATRDAFDPRKTFR